MKKIFSILLISLFSFNNNTYSQWTERVSGVTVQLTSASFNAFSPWICGYNGTVLRSSNDGNTWINVSGNGIPNNVLLVNIISISNSTVVTAGYIGSNTYVYKTTNNGANWTQVFFQSGGFINAITQLSGGLLFMQGDPVGGRWSLWRSSNEGISWDSTGLYLPQAGTEAGWNNSIFTWQNDIWFGTNNFRLYRSTNNGTTWSISATPTEQNTYAVYFALYFYPQDGICAGANMLRTTNGGINWSTVTTLGTGNFGGIVGSPYPVADNIFSDIDIAWYVRSDNKIYQSFGGAMNWQVQYSAPAGNYRYVGGRPMGPFLAVRDNGGISFHPYLVGINQISSDVPSSFSLFQNYPNPFNPSTTIRFDISKKSFTRLIVYNSIGSEVESLVNESLDAGSYEYKWDASKISSGVYYYRIISDEFSATKKMILLK